MAMFVTENEDNQNPIQKCLGKDAFCSIKMAQILVVGSGGIGCELLKNLVLTGFQNIEIVDLDTIDVSNLNRQFLFRPHHVGKSKCQVAREAALKFNPTANIIAHHGNIKTSTFGLNFFKKFNLVMNALDNLDARRHVNRICLAAGIPLIEAGSTGYLGQVTVIKKGETECYECQPKAAQKVYPICTIRSTPDKPVHCIVWAKELYKLLFGQPENSMLFESDTTGDASTYMDKIIPPGSLDANALLGYAKDILIAVFYSEVQKQIGMDRYKAATNQPEPLDPLLVSCCNAKEERPAHTGAGWDRSIWTVLQCIAELLSCISEMWLDDNARSLMGTHDFDKDDAKAMFFVTAAANLRANTFHIPLQNLYETKGIAGNIIPAIATTNAIIAGLEVLEAIKVLSTPTIPIKEKCRFTYCLRNATRKGLILQPTKLAEPSPSCFVCNSAQLELHINTATTTLEGLVNSVLKARLSVNEPSVGIGCNTIYEEGEGADENLRRNLAKLLQDLPAGGIKDGVTIIVEDFSQDLSFNLNVYHRDIFDEETHPEGFIIEGMSDNANAKRKCQAPNQADSSKMPAPTKDNANGEEDDFLLLVDVEKQNRRKRQRIEDVELGKASVSREAAWSLHKDHTAIEIID